MSQNLTLLQFSWFRTRTCTTSTQNMNLSSMTNYNWVERTKWKKKNKTKNTADSEKENKNEQSQEWTKKKTEMMMMNFGLLTWIATFRTGYLDRVLCNFTLISTFSSFWDFVQQYSDCVEWINRFAHALNDISNSSWAARNVGDTERYLPPTKGMHRRQWPSRKWLLPTKMKRMNDIHGKFESG